MHFELPLYKSLNPNDENQVACLLLFFGQTLMDMEIAKGTMYGYYRQDMKELRRKRRN